MLKFNKVLLASDFDNTLVYTQGALERGGIDLPFHPGGEAVDGGILLLLQRGVERARGVELIPFAVGLGHPMFPLSFCAVLRGSL